MNTVIKKSALLVAMLSSMMGCKSAQAPQFQKKLPIAVQLYSVRGELEKDFYGTLKAVKDMGYTGVEFYGEYYGNTPLQVKKWCTELGLVPMSNHIPFQEMMDDFDKVVADNTIIGVQYLVFPYMDEASRPGMDMEQFKKTVAQIGECGAKARAAGFQLLYHNHDFEFVPMEDGSMAYDYIFGSNQPGVVQNEFDVCWVDYSGNDVVGYLQKYAGSIPVVHLKNYQVEGKLSTAPYALIGVNTDNSMKDEGGWFEYRPLGEGQLDMVEIIKAAIAGDANWLCVEQDEPSQGRSPLGGIQKSAEYLKTLGLM